jgi:hypothetical protein
LQLYEQIIIYNILIIIIEYAIYCDFNLVLNNKGCTKLGFLLTKTSTYIYGPNDNCIIYDNIFFTRHNFIIYYCSVNFNSYKKNKSNFNITFQQYLNFHNAIKNDDIKNANIIIDRILEIGSLIIHNDFLEYIISNKAIGIAKYIIEKHKFSDIVNSRVCLNICKSIKDESCASFLSLLFSKNYPNMNLNFSKNYWYEVICKVINCDMHITFQILAKYCSNNNSLFDDDILDIIFQKYYKSTFSFDFYSPITKFIVETYGIIPNKWIDLINNNKIVKEPHIKFLFLCESTRNNKIMYYCIAYFPKDLCNLIIGYLQTFTNVPIYIIKN